MTQSLDIVIRNGLILDDREGKFKVDEPYIMGFDWSPNGTDKAVRVEIERHEDGSYTIHDAHEFEPAEGCREEADK